jgi:UDP-3-O-[3-hydroxymyristoyl] glucosamine N-acyltransferase
MAIATPEPLPSACLLADDIEMGIDCEIGRFVVIETGVRLGDRVRIGDGAFVGEGSRIGDDSRIGQRATIREHSWIGKRVLIEAGAILGADGFGFAQRADGTQFKIPQAGIVEIGDDCHIGARATIDRATLGKTLLRDGVRVGPQVMVGHNVVIGEGCELDAQCGVSGSTKIGARTWIGSQAGLVGHLEVGEGCRIEAYTGVTKKLAPNTHLKGVFPAMAPEQFDRQQELVARLPDLVERLEKLETKTAQAV